MSGSVWAAARHDQALRAVGCLVPAGMHFSKALRGLPAGTRLGRFRLLCSR
jgi:hypothetical protein